MISPDMTPVGVIQLDGEEIGAHPARPCGEAPRCKIGHIHGRQPILGKTNPAGRAR